MKGGSEGPIVDSGLIVNSYLYDWNVTLMYVIAFAWLVWFTLGLPRRASTVVVIACISYQ